MARCNHTHCQNVGVTLHGTPKHTRQVSQENGTVEKRDAGALNQES